MILTVSTKREFIPKFNGNDKAPAAEQVKFIHKAATISMKEKLFPREFEYGADGKVSGSFVVDRKKIIREFVIDMLNISYQYDDSKEIVKVKNVDDLFNAPPEMDGLIDEVYNYFQDLLNQKVNEKN